MRALVQRVRRGAVHVEERVVGQVGHGFVILLGVTHTDTQAEADWLAAKVAGLRVFEDEAGKMNHSLLDVGGGALVVSQFTLYADAQKGRRPSFVQAAAPEAAAPLVDYFCQALQQQGVPVQTGQFGAMMRVEIINDGPVTLWLEKEAAPP